MSALELAIVIGLAYVITGMALVGYDMAAPLLERKQYVIRKNFKVAVITWFVWPATAVFDATEERKMRRPYRRFLFGVALLALGVFLWAQVAYLASLWLIGISWAAFIVTAIATLLAPPILTGIVMPPHRRYGDQAIRSGPAREP